MIAETILCLYVYENPFGILTLKLEILLYAEAVPIRGKELRAEEEEERNFLSMGLRRDSEDGRERNKD